MASAPLAIGHTLVSPPQTAEAGSPPDDIKTSINQSGKISFPQVMKKLKDGADDKSSDTPPGAIVLANIHATDAALPPPGTLLPLGLAQGHVPTDQSDPALAGDQAAAVTANGGMPLTAIGLEGGGKGKGGNSGRQTAMPPGDKGTSITPQAAQQVSGNAAANVSDPSAVHDQSPATAKLDSSSLLAPVQSNQLPLQVLSHNLSGNPLDKHASLIDGSSHMGLDTASGLSNLAQGSDKLNQTPATPPPISVPLKNPQWGDELSNRVMWMTQHDVQTANIKINPPHLGPLEVQVSMHKDQVDVTFHSHHAGVKEALDASMPKLKEMLGSSGLQLGDANVTHHSFSGQSQYDNQGSNHYSSGGAGQDIDTPITDTGEMTSASMYNWNTGSGAIDFYA